MIKCPRCGSENVSSKESKLKCEDCNFEFAEEKELFEKLGRDLAEKERKKMELKLRENREQLKKDKEEEYNKSVSLLEECDDELIAILSLNNVPIYTVARDERIDTLARKFDSSTLKSKISNAEVEREKKEKEYNESFSLLQQCDTHIINLLSINNVPDDARSRERKIDELSKQFDSSTLQEKIDALKKEQEEKIKNDASVDSWAFVILILVLLIIIFLSGF